MINTVDNKVEVTYPLNFTEQEVQGLIQELNELDYNKINIIELDTEDIAMSLLFYFKKLIENSELNITILVRESIYNNLILNFNGVFNDENLKVKNE